MHSVFKGEQDQKFYTVSFDFILFKLHSKTAHFAFDIQISPYCDDESSEMLEPNQFYFGSDDSIFQLIWCTFSNEKLKQHVLFLLRHFHVKKHKIVSGTH